MYLARGSSTRKTNKFSEYDMREILMHALSKIQLKKLDGNGWDILENSYEETTDKLEAFEPGLKEQLREAKRVDELENIHGKTTQLQTYSQTRTEGELW